MLSSDRRLLHQLLQQLMLTAARHLPGGGYMVRAQEGELRYMLAFATPTAAAEWCLLVQEAALYLPYPEQLLLQCKALRVEHDTAGRLVFRGPRLKMGLFEGSPTAIMPDSMGRADYFGACVNTAARFADAAAHGGQIVTDAALAKQVLHLWRQQQQQQMTSSCGGSAASSSGLVQPSTSQPASSSSKPQQQQQEHIPPSQLAAAGAAASILEQTAAATPEPGSPTSPAAAAAGKLPAAAAAAAGLGTITVPVEVHWLGSFMFKGSPRSFDMVGLLPSCLAGRQFAAEAPKGKGLRVAVRQGLAERGLVLLPGAVSGYKLFTQ
jgi:hypothetical protein